MTDAEENTPIDDTSSLADEWTLANTPELSEGTIVKHHGVVMYSRLTKWVDEKTKENMEATKAYFYVKRDDRVLPTRCNKITIEALERAFGTKVSKYVNKKVRAVHNSIGQNTFIVWKPEGLDVN